MGRPSRTARRTATPVNRDDERDRTEKEKGNMSDNPVWKAVKPFVNGGASGMVATCCIQPIDIVKVRIQLGASGSPLGIAGNIVKQEGFFTLYKGLSAGLLRQATYTPARLGIFKTITEEAKKMNEGKPLPLWQKAICGLTAGGLGSLVGSPADLALIRMQADGTLPPEQRRNYRNAFHSLSSIAKEVLDSYGVTGAPKIFGASAIAGFFASAFSLPLDFIKTQIQKMKPDANGKMPYTGALDCAVKTMAEGGPLAFYKGFPTYYVRIAPHSMITLIVLNYIQEFQRDNGF